MADKPSELIKEKLDIVTFLRGYLALQPAGKNFKATCPFHKEKTPSFMVSPERQSWHCFGCFPPGQKIKTPFGYHNIETIDKQHFVYSGKGEIRKVLAVIERNYKGELIDIFVRKLGGATSLTADHILKVIKPTTKHYKKTKQFYRRCRDLIARGATMSSAIEKYGVVVEVPSREIQESDFVLYPINTRTADPKQINLRDYLTKSYTRGHHPIDLPYIQKIADSFLKFIGYWIAEGSNHRAYIRFSIGDHEEDFAREIAGLSEELFGLEAKIYRRPRDKKKTGLEITICHSYLANIFENFCGKGAANKHIPFIFQDMQPAQQKLLVDAIFKGDGTSFTSQFSTKKSKAITTISRVLAEQIVDILLRNNIFPSLQVAKAKKDKIGVNHREAYTIRWSEEAVSRHRFIYREADGATYWILPVKKIERRVYAGPVYNLTVDKDHSYIANNFAVANCGSHGDIFGFLMRYENLEFGEALRILAEKSGVELKRLNPAEHKFTGLLYELNDKAKDFWKQALQNNETAKKYLADRGLKKETIEEFELGWAANESEALGMHLLNSGYAPDDLLRAGLSFKTERGLLLDRFRGRIMFPIHNHFGRVVGFTGRILPQFEKPEVGNPSTGPGFVPAKYINSPETPIFVKSRLLYGFWKSKNAIRDVGSAFLVEGQMDFLMSWQAGVQNVAASSGTALTLDHLRSLRRVSEEIVLSFDNDEAGSAAAERAIDLAESGDFNVKVLVFEKHKDPAEMVEAGGDLKKEVEGSVPAPLFYFGRYLPKKEFGSFSRPEELKKLRIVLGKLKSIASPVLKSHWFHELSKRTGLDEKILIEEAERIEIPKTGSEKLSSADQGEKDLPRRYSRRELIGERLLRMAAATHDYVFLDDSIPYLALNHQGVLKMLERGERKSSDPKADDLLNFIILGAEKLDAEEVAGLKRELVKEHLKEKRVELALRVRRAEELGDEPAMKLALEELNGLSVNSVEI